MNNIVGILASLIYIFLVLSIATFAARYVGQHSEVPRKLVHILVGNWVFITPLFDQLWALIAVPLLFVIVNWISKIKQVFQAMERDDDSWGTVYYAISLLVLSLLAYWLKKPVILYAGILIMAYGDGLAALIGRKYGKRQHFMGVQGKSLPGSVCVAIVSGLISFICLIYFYRHVAIWYLLFLAIITGLYAAVLELISHKGLDNLTLPIGTGLFITVSTFSFNRSYLLFLMLIGFILLLAFLRHKLTLDGVAVAFLTGAIIFSLGNLWLGLALLSFFILGTVITKFGPASKPDKSSSAPRNWKQVVANSFPSVILVLGYSLYGFEEFLMIAFSIFSAAASDTFASELGTKTNSKVVSIITLKEVPKGISGGVSILGLGFSILGSFLLALYAYPSFGWTGFWINGTLGVFGMLLDSVLGATLQQKYAHPDGSLRDTPAYKGQRRTHQWQVLTNNGVNFITLCLVAVVGILWIAIQMLSANPKYK